MAVGSLGAANRRAPTLKGGRTGLDEKPTARKDPVDKLDALVVAARAGGDWAFARLWEELSGSVAGYLRARGVIDVDDVTSEVFLAAFSGVGTFEGDGGRFRAWLFTIAHHRGVDGLRAQIKAADHEPYVEELDRRTVSSAEDTSLHHLQSDEVRVALGDLTPEQRDVVLLRFVADLSVDEVAVITGRSVGAVKQLQRRGIRQLRRHLNGAIADGPITSVPALPIAEL